jgi:hypothetical protein
MCQKVYLMSFSNTYKVPSFVIGMLLTSTASAATLVPAAVLPSSFLIELEFEAQVATAGSANNINSPVSIGDDLYVVNERNSTLSVRKADGSTVQLLDETTLPTGVTRPQNTGILNIAGEGDKAYVAFYSSTLPTAFGTPDALPTDPRYPAAVPRFELIYAYDRAADGSLINPAPLKAFEASTNGHRSAGMLVMPDGSLLYARGDNLRPEFDGLSAPQELGSSVSKLVLIDTDTGASEIVGQGLRNVQRLTYTDETKTQIAFADIGWQVAEEINQVSVADLVDTSIVENFGWGRNADGNAREGTFYVNEGPEAVAMAIGEAPLNEAGFVQPFAQFGREDRTGFFAVSGPVASSVSFDAIGFLFADLASGDLFATAAGATGTGNDVFSVMVKGTDGLPTTISDYFGLGTQRDDPRFFNFADNSAGVLFEKSGAIYRINEVSAITAVPLPASGLLLATMLAFGGIASRSRKQRRQG